MPLESTKVHARPKAPAKWRYGNTAVVSRMRGAAAVEYGLLLPMLLLFILGLMECGRLFWTYTTLDRAAEAAARCGAVNATLCATSTQIQNYAVTQAYGLTISASAFTASTPACGVQVTASFPFTLVIPFVTAGTPSGAFNIITLSAAACYPI
jgi:Flp pilus assembly protein TadG